MGQYLRPATFEDVEFIAANMRAADRIECAAFGFEPLDNMMTGLKQAAISLAVDDPKTGLPIGIVSVHAGGLIGFLSTDVIAQYPITLLRQSRALINELHKYSDNGRLYNWVSANNVLHLQWLKWLGFTIYEDRPVEVNNISFYHFERFPET